MRTKYSIEINNLGLDLTGYFASGRYIEADYIVAYGNSLDEVLEDAEIMTIDQDGGSGPSLKLSQLSDSYWAKYSKLIAEMLELDYN
jgi:hypothetical protein